MLPCLTAAFRDLPYERASVSVLHLVWTPFPDIGYILQPAFNTPMLRTPDTRSSHFDRFKQLYVSPLQTRDAVSESGMCCPRI